MKKTTKDSSKGLRNLAAFEVFFGTLATAVDLVMAIFICVDINFKIVSLIPCLIFMVVIIFCTYVGYVLISAYATVVENSDRTEVVEAINDLAVTISMLDPEVKEKAKKDLAYDKAMAVITKKMEEIEASESKEGEDD